MQARIIASGFSQQPLNARFTVEFAPESQAEHDLLATMFPSAALLDVVGMNRSAGDVIRAEFEIVPRAQQVSK